LNAREKRTIKQEAERFMKGIVIKDAAEPSAVILELPMLDAKKNPIRFFIGKRPKAKKFSLLVPIESVGLLAVNSTLAKIQPVLKTYGLILSQTAVILEENHTLPLHKRIGNITQAIIGIDGLVRLWNSEFRRNPDAFESKDSKSVSDRPNNCTSR